MPIFRRGLPKRQRADIGKVLKAHQVIRKVPNMRDRLRGRHSDVYAHFQELLSVAVERRFRIERAEIIPLCPLEERCAKVTRQQSNVQARRLVRKLQFRQEVT